MYLSLHGIVCNGLIFKKMLISYIFILFSLTLLYSKCLYVIWCTSFKYIYNGYTKILLHSGVAFKIKH